MGRQNRNWSSDAVAYEALPKSWDDQNNIQKKTSPAAVCSKAPGMDTIGAARK